MTAPESEQTPTGESQPDKSPPEAPAPGEGNGSGESRIPESVELHQHHVSKILDQVLDEPDPAVTPRKIKHPMILDVGLAVGLLVAMGGFTIGLFKMYLTHSAEQSITQHNYKAAIGILKGAPLPGFFVIPGSDPEELLSQALYLDAMNKLDVDNDVEGALKELQQIKPGSRYFVLAQEIIQENFVPASVTLQGGAEHLETDPQKQPEHKPLIEIPEDGSK